MEDIASESYLFVQLYSNSYVIIPCILVSLLSIHTLRCWIDVTSLMGDLSIRRLNGSSL